jgi:hypothetical protein
MVKKNISTLLSARPKGFIQDGDKIKIQKDICHHGPKPIPIIFQLPDPPTFSLLPTFKYYTYVRYISMECLC